MPITEPDRPAPRPPGRHESGNVLFYLLIGIVLIALVTVAVKRGGGEGSNIDNENTVIAASQVKQYASELERGVDIMLHNGVSESDIRFAHPNAPAAYGAITDTPARQVFDRQGGGVEYRSAPSGANDGSGWEFYGTTHAPQVGSANRSDLIAVLPNVTPALCARLNQMAGYAAGTQPADTGTCLYTGATGRFAGAYDDSGTPNTADDTTFSVKPAMEACVVCDSGKYHYYHVLIAR